MFLSLVGVNWWLLVSFSCTSPVLFLQCYSSCVGRKLHRNTKLATWKWVKYVSLRLIPHVETSSGLCSHSSGFKHVQTAKVYIQKFLLVIIITTQICPSCSWYADCNSFSVHQMLKKRRETQFLLLPTSSKNAQQQQSFWLLCFSSSLHSASRREIL